VYVCVYTHTHARARARARDLTSDCSSFVVPGLQLRKILLKITIIRISHVPCREISHHIYMYESFSCCCGCLCVCILYIYIYIVYNHIHTHTHKHPQQRHNDTHTHTHTHIYRVSQEECARLRESVPYVKLYRYNPKQLCPK
jgi:hypothetical protein